jgi:hypothetical protein
MEQHRLRLLEGKVLKGIFGAKRDEIIRRWRKRHYEEFHNLYSSPNIITMVKSKSEMGLACSKHGREKCIQNFGWKTRRKETTRKT